MAFFEELSGSGEVVGGVEDVVVKGVSDGVVVDLDVGQQVKERGLELERFLEIVDFMSERGDARFQLVLNFGWNGNAFGRHSDVFADGRVSCSGRSNG